MAHFLYRPLLMLTITAASILTGNQFSLSYVSLASILSTPSTPEHILLAQFKTSFLRGFHLCPMNAIPTSVVCLLNAILTWYYGAIYRAAMLLIVGGCIIGLVPFTLKFIVPGEEVLLKKNARVQKAIEEKREKCGDGVAESEGGVEETRKEMEEWVRLNYIRSIFPAVGVCVAWSLL